LALFTRLYKVTHQNTEAVWDRARISERPVEQACLTRRATQLRISHVTNACLYCCRSLEQEGVWQRTPSCHTGPSPVPILHGHRWV